MIGPHPDTPEAACVCGSRQTFAECCATQVAGTTAIWARTKAAERRLIPEIAAYAISRWGISLRNEALSQFWCGSMSAESGCALLPLWGPWFVFNWVARDSDFPNETPSEWPTTSLGISWSFSGRPISEGDQRLILAAADRMTSVLLVEAVVPGWAMQVLDLLSGRRHLVVDPTVSKCARPDELLLGGVYTMDGVSMLLGPASHAIPSDWRVETTELRQDWGEDNIDQQRASEFDARALYCRAFERRQSPVSFLDRLGHPEEPVLIRWHLRGDVEEAIERLRSLTTAFDDDSIDLIPGHDGRPRAMLIWHQRGDSDDPDDWLARGYLHLSDRGLSADVPTRASADALIAEVAFRFGESAVILEQRPGRMLTPLRQDEPLTLQALLLVPSPR